MTSENPHSTLSVGQLCISIQDVGTLGTYNRALEKIGEAGEKTEASYETTHSGERGK